MPALYAAMVLLALAITLVAFKRDYDATRVEVEQRAEAYARSMATDVRWYLDVVRQTLNRVSDQLAGLEMSSSNYSTVIEEALSDLPAGVVIVVYDASGISRAFMGYSSMTIDISDRRYFQQLREGRAWVISNVITDRVTGKKTFAVGRSLHQGDVFRGAAVAYAPMEVLSEAWLAVGGQATNAFLVHDEGWLTARLPPIDSEVYDQQLSRDFVETFTRSDQGSYWAEASPIDGVARVVGYARVASQPLIAVIGISPEQPLRAFWRRVALTLAALLSALALLGVATWYMRKLMIRQEATADRLAHSLARNETLLLEIHHRVKNNLQSALSLFRIHVRDPAILAEVEPRIHAMVSVHEHIYNHDEFLGVHAETFICRIAQRVLYASSNHIQLKTDIENIELPSKIVMPIGQLVNEALINAIKYGYPDGRAGTVHISLVRGSDDVTTLTIHNDGAPLPGTGGGGMGSRLMKAFAAQMGGSVETTSDAGGVTVKAIFQLTPGAQSQV